MTRPACFRAYCSAPSLSPPSMPDRRTFLATLGAAAVGGAGFERLMSCLGASPGLDTIGVQLYTVRSEMARDMPGTLARVAAIGFREVELAGYFGRTPGQVRAMLEENGLSAPSAHVEFPVLGDAWDRVLAGAAAAGHQYVTVPWIPDQRRRTLDDYRRVAAGFNRAGEAARAAGLRLAYHNHDFELRHVDGVVPLDVLLSDTDPALVDYEMDVYWVVRGGGDPIEYLARHPGRFTMVHAKDSEGPPQHRMTEVGSGIIDFPRVLTRAIEQGLRHVFVEHDQPADGFNSIASSYRYLKTVRIDR